MAAGGSKKKAGATEVSRSPQAGNLGQTATQGAQAPLKVGLTAAGRPPSSATGRADEDGDKVADEMSEEEDKELRWKDSGDLSSAAKTP